MEKRAELHHGHRERIWNRFLQDGLEGFEDHQVLELLLFNAIARQDTNPLAHQLIKRYGSLSAVLEADPKDLASFLSLIPPVARRYLHDRAVREKKPLTDLRTVVEFLYGLMAGRAAEVFYVICLDARDGLLYPALVNEGTVKGVLVEPRLVAETVFRHRAAKVILAHNHPSGNPEPSHLTHILNQALILLEVKVMDHIIIANESYFSFAQHGMLGAPTQQD